MSNKIVTTFELCRGVAKLVQPGNPNLAKDVQRIITKFNRYIAQSFAKAKTHTRGTTTVCVEVPHIGQFISMIPEDFSNSPQYDLVPCQLLQQECCFPQRQGPDCDIKKEISISHISDLAQVDMEMTSQILQGISQHIVSFFSGK